MGKRQPVSLCRRQLNRISELACPDARSPANLDSSDRKWTTVLYERREDDFVDAGLQIGNDFQSLYSALEDAWKEMCKFSGELVENKTYLELRSKGDSPQALDVKVRLRLPPVSSAQVSSGAAINKVIVSSATDRKFG